MTPELIYAVASTLVANLIGAGVVWGTVRAKLQGLEAGVAEAKADATEAHRRIDQLLLNPRS